jgi:tetratricopeptide (TPR) repeat protein
VVQPDRLAEPLVVVQLGASAMLAQACLTHLDERQARRSVLLLARAATENDIAERLLERLLPLVAQVVEEISAPLGTLVSIANAIPFPSVVLAAAHAAVTGRILNGRPADAHRAERARWLTIRGQTLAQLGLSAEALPATQQAVSIYRELSAVNPGRYRPDLAGSLSNLGVWLSRDGLSDEALLTAQEAVGLYRELTVLNPGRYRPDLATALSNLGGRFSALGRPAEALPPEQEAVSIYRDVAAVNPDRYQANLITALSNIAVTLTELGRNPEAAQARLEARRLRS